MKHSKRIFGIIIFITVCIVSNLSLTSCKKYDDIMLNFYRDTSDDKFNAIEIDLGNNNSAIYFINERYGIWLNEGDKHLFDFEYVPETQGGGALMIYVATQQSYYDSIIQRNDGLTSFHNGKMAFSGSC